MPLKRFVQGLTGLLPGVAARRRRVPVVRQLSAVECGAACLSMILGYYDCPTRVDECREQMGVGRDGVTALTIARVARRFGLRVKAYTLDPPDLRHVRLPAIVHWNFNHFIVVEHWTEKYVRVVDPAQGRLRLTPEEFAAGFTGVVLMFEPGVNFERGRKARRSRMGRYLFGYVLRAPGALAQIILASLVLQVLGLAIPLLTKLLIDDVLPMEIGTVMYVIGIGIIVLVLTQTTISYLRSRLLLHLQMRLDTQMMLGFFEHLLTLPLRFFQQRASGDLLMRLSSNTVIREMFTSQTISVLLDGTFVFTYLLILLLQQPVLGLLALGIGSLQVLLLLGTKRRVHQLMQRELAAQAESQSYLVEALTRIETLKASGTEDRVFDRWTDLFFKQLNVSYERNHLSTIIETGRGTLHTFSPLILLWAGAYLALSGALTVGTMLALVALATSFLTSLSSLAANLQRCQLVGSYLERIADVLETESEQDLRLVEEPPRLTGKIELRGVGFRYDPEASWVFRNISLTIRPGQKIALVGRTGSGKSTLANLLLSLYTPTEGEIFYDDIPLRSLNYRSLRRQFGVVCQDSLLFSGSIRRNITYSDADVSFERVVEAARLAALD
ncbi:MAG: peptidase domain-containing ABC transporter, partial [Pyrinomonadaceae bacterium]